MTVSITKDNFIKVFPFIIEGILIEDEKVKELLGNTKEIPDNIWKAISYIAEIYVSPKSNKCVLTDSLREKAIYLTLAVYLIKTISNFILRRNSGQITNAKEGEVSVSYQDVPTNTIKDWFLTDSTVQPFGTLLWQILQQAQPCPVVNLNYPVPYYDNYI